MTGRTLDRVGVFSLGVARLPRLRQLLGHHKLVFRPSANEARTLDAVIGWGHKPTADRARDYARAHGVPYLALEDGFLRSVGLGRQQPPLSLVVDDLGIYYDARAPSRLERLLSGEGGDLLADPGLVERARRCRERLIETGVSKYNHAPDVLPPALAQGERYVLVVDQTEGDASVTQGLCEAVTFERMLEAALAEHPDERIVVKVHPETVAGKKRGYLAQRGKAERIVIVADDVAPAALLRRASHAYVCTSQLGFEALLFGVPVSCFGMPFYAGWGLTDDRQTSARRNRRRSLDELVAAALLVYPNYVHPVTDTPCQAEDLIEHLALQRRMLADNRRQFHCLGFTFWKRPFVRRYLSAPGGSVSFARSTAELAREATGTRATLVVWSSKRLPEVATLAERRALSLWNMEDGFLRSVGLGSDLTAPGSLVLDRQGIYYDPRTASDLESLLEKGGFSAAELDRARSLRQRIVESGISKYNPQSRRSLRLHVRAGQTVVLVPGQVEDDASVRCGQSELVFDNRTLLEAVRKACPEAYLIYKPHPDVLSGNRRGAVAPPGDALWDELALGVTLAECLAAAGEVHTLTSLVGFEALLRGLPVTCHGAPFYAGWGLTSDRSPTPRRTRRLTLDELVAGVLLRYPRYYSFRAHCFCSAEEMVLELERQRRRQGRTPELPRFAKKLLSLSASAVEWATQQEWPGVR